jgi:ketosteroid isomerase-like protein
VRDGLVVQEWTAAGTHAESGRSATWDGMDILPTRDGKFARKDVYSDSMSVMRQLGRI